MREKDTNFLKRWQENGCSNKISCRLTQKKKVKWNRETISNSFKQKQNNSNNDNNTIITLTTLTKVESAKKLNTDEFNQDNNETTTTALTPLITN